MNNFAFYTNYTNVIRSLPKELQAEFALAIINYGSEQIVPEFSNPLLNSVFISLKLSLDKSINKAKSRQEEEIKKEQNENKQNQKKSNENKNNQNERNNKIIKYSNNQILKCSKKIKKNQNPVAADAAVADKPRLEYEFYIWTFGKCYKRHFRATNDVYKKFLIRRKEFSFEEIYVSLCYMSTDGFYKPKDDDDSWQPKPVWHLHNEEHVARFLSGKDIEEFTQDMLEKLPEEKRKFMAERQNVSGKI